MNDLSDFGKVMKLREQNSTYRLAMEILTKQITEIDLEETTLQDLNVSQDDLEKISGCVFQAYNATSQERRNLEYAELGKLVADLLVDRGIEPALTQAESQLQCG